MIKKITILTTLLAISSLIQSDESIKKIDCALNTTLAISESALACTSAKLYSEEDSPFDALLAVLATSNAIACADKATKPFVTPQKKEGLYLHAALITVYYLLFKNFSTGTSKTLKEFQSINLIFNEAVKMARKINRNTSVNNQDK